MVHIKYHKIHINDNATHGLTFLPFPFLGLLFLFVYELKTQNIYTINTDVALVI